MSNRLPLLLSLLLLWSTSACAEDRALEGLFVPAGQVLSLESGDESELVLSISGSVQIEGTLRCSGPLRIQALGSIEVAEGGRVEAPGEIWLEAGPETTSWIRGAVEVFPRDEVGGRLTLLGDRLGIGQGAELAADGQRVGGWIRVGGGPLGASLSGPSARRVYVAEGARLSAAASRQGDGGRIVIWGDEVARCYGRLNAGDAGGQGGEVEVSGAEVDYAGEVWVGRNGLFRIDPATITITDGGPSAAPQADVAFADATPTSIAELTLEGTSAGQNATIALQALNQITINDLADNSITLSAGVNLTLQTRNDTALGDSATGGVTFNSPEDTLRLPGDGTLLVEAGSGGTTGAADVTLGGLSSQTARGTLTVRASGSIACPPSSGLFGRTLTLSCQGALNLTATGFVFTSSESVSVTAGGAIGSAGTPMRVNANTSVGVQLSSDTSGANGAQFFQFQGRVSSLDLDAGSGNVTLSTLLAAARHVTDSDAAVDVRCGTFAYAPTVGDHDLGTAASPIQTQASVLALDTSAINSDLHVLELDTLTSYSLEAGSGAVTLGVGAGNLIDTGNTLTTTGALTLRADAGSIGTAGDVFTLPAATTNLTTNTATTNTDQFLSASNLSVLNLDAGTGNVTLSALISVLDTDGGVDVRGGAVSLTVGGGNNLGSAANPIQTQATSLACSGGFVFLSEFDGLSGLNLSCAQLTLTAGGAVTDTDAAVDVASPFPTITVNNGDLGTSANPIECSSTGLTVVTTTGNGNQFIDKTNTGGPNDFRAGTGNITLTALNILDTDAAVDFTCGSLSLTTSTGAMGSSGNPLGLNVATLTASSAATNQDQFFSEADTLTGINLNAGTGNVNLTTGGAISDADGAVDVTCNVATITATTGGIGSAGNRIQTSVSDLAVTTTNGDQFFTETDALTAANLNAGTGGITFTGGGALSDADGAADFTCGDLTLAATALGAGANPLGTNVSTLTSDTSGSNGDQFLTEANGLTALNVNAGTGGVTLGMTTGNVSDGDGATDVTGGAVAVTVTAGSFGVMGVPIAVEASTSLSVDTSGGNGDQFLTSTGTLAVPAANGLNAGTGNVNLGAGTLLVNGSSTATLVRANGGTVGGTGTIGALQINTGAALAPGASPGITNTGNLTLGAGSTTTMEIGGTSPGTGAGFHDQINVTGTVTIDPTATLSMVSFGGFVPSAGDSFVLINNDGVDAITGTFQGLAEGALVTGFLGSALVGQVSYVGGDGNDFVVTAVQTADIAVSKTVSDAAPKDQDRVTYTVTATNNGPGNATGVQLTDALPAGVTLSTATPSQGTYNSTSGLWTIGALNNGASATLTLEVIVAAGAGTTITNATSGLSGTILGGSTADDVGSVALTVAAPATGGGGGVPLAGSVTVTKLPDKKGCAISPSDSSGGWAALLCLLLALAGWRVLDARAGVTPRAN